jgi:hypothetical protein
VDEIPEEPEMFFFALKLETAAFFGVKMWSESIFPATARLGEGLVAQFLNIKRKSIMTKFSQN